MKILFLSFFLFGCGSSHYITKGRKACDDRNKKIYSSNHLWKNDKLMKRHIEECSYYYDEAH